MDRSRTCAGDIAGCLALRRILYAEHQSDARGYRALRPYRLGRRARRPFAIGGPVQTRALPHLRSA